MCLSLVEDIMSEQIQWLAAIFCVFTQGFPPHKALYDYKDNGCKED